MRFIMFFNLSPMTRALFALQNTYVKESDNMVSHSLCVTISDVEKLVSIEDWAEFVTYWQAVMSIGAFARALGALPDPVKAYNAPVNTSIGTIVFEPMVRPVNGACSNATHRQAYSIAFSGRVYFGECVRSHDGKSVTYDVYAIFGDSRGFARNASKAIQETVLPLIESAFKANVRAYADAHY